jgi:hypothetical protein
MNYVKYNRTFVMLEEQNRQFAEKESAPVKGYLKVETGNNKGALRCIVQNLKYFEKGDYIYKLILFGKKGERTIHTIIGNLVINRQGNGETYFRFLPMDIDGKGNAYHHYTTAIIAAASTQDSKEPLHPVLKGVTFSEVEPFQSELFPVDEGPEKGQSPEFEDLIGKIDKIVDDLEQTLRDERFDERFSEGSSGEPERGRAKKEPAPEPLQSEADSAPKEKREEAPREEIAAKKNYNGFYNEYILNACAHTCRIAEFYEDVVPFNRTGQAPMEKDRQYLQSAAGISRRALLRSRYRHYIFGAKPDENGIAVKFFFGIPGGSWTKSSPTAENPASPTGSPSADRTPSSRAAAKGNRATGTYTDTGS